MVPPMAPKILGRQTSPIPTSSGSSTPSQPTNVIPLTTTFTPPATCTAGILSMLPPPGYFIWANEPVPARNETSTGCYPSEFLSAYTSIASGKDQTSIVPAMSPLICPKSFCTVFAGDNNYLACCPSGYQFHPPDTTVNASRPAYGGTCYSDLTISSTYTVVAYDSAGASRTQQWIGSTTGAQAFAHPIDGFAETPAAIRCGPVPAKSSEVPVQDAVKNTLSRGGIAGAVLGGLVGLALLLALVLFLLRRRKNANKMSNGMHELSSSGEKPAQLHDNNTYAKHEATDASLAEIGSSGHPLSGTHELSAEPIYEVEANQPKITGLKR